MYVPLDVNFPDDDKIVEAGIDGAGLFVFALCLAKRTEQDGKVSRVLLRRMGGTDELFDRLVTIGLFDERDGGLWVTRWLKHNMSKADLDAKRAAEAERKRKSRGNVPSGHAPDTEGIPPESERVRTLEIREEKTEIETPQQQDTDRADLSRDACIDAAIDLLLRRDGSIQLSQSKQNPSGWLNAARSGRRSDHWQVACKAWTPGMSAEALADILEPPAANPSARLAEYVAQGGSDMAEAKANVSRIPRVGPKVASA